MPKSTIPFAATVVAIVLSGCTGQHMSVRSVNNHTLVQEGDVAMVPITSQLVSQQPRPVMEIPAELTGYRPDSYRIHPGDTILVTVWDHPELTTPAGSQQQAVSNGRLVKPDGTLFYPYAGNVEVAGMTIEQLRDTLTSRLSKFLLEPKVDVNVVGFGSRVSLQGAFVDTTPQEVTTVPLTLSQAIGTAQIDLDQADLSGLVLTRDQRNYRIDLDALNRNGNVAQQIYLKPGDHLFLPFNDRKEVYVIGEVLRPQAITFKTSDITLTQALGRTGGLNPATSKGEAVYVIRGVEDMQSAPATVYHLDAASPVAFALADRFPLQAGDVVWVGPAGVTRWNRFLTQLLPLSGLISNTAAAQYNIDRAGN
ncbi:polysaccharide biosynthesis/export family protein [Luteimonas sp. R10]|uniref:polysaccharide biosynthesis/export family protein n=1 Tax=Luteimonas sp. R10 TaxID=3108176 RepID=UPI00308FAF04|nr:polysaccharide biosynthesis/export family protein [Luteimonas sp. R10]